MPQTRRLRGSHHPSSTIVVIAHNGATALIQTASGNRASVSAAWLAAQTRPVH